jgi:hypothetical protein
MAHLERIPDSRLRVVCVSTSVISIVRRTVCPQYNENSNINAQSHVPFLTQVTSLPSITVVKHHPNQTSNPPNQRSRTRTRVKPQRRPRKHVLSLRVSGDPSRSLRLLKSYQAGFAIALVFYILFRAFRFGLP